MNDQIEQIVSEQLQSDIIDQKRLQMFVQAMLNNANDQVQCVDKVYELCKGYRIASELGDCIAAIRKAEQDFLDLAFRIAGRKPVKKD